MKQAAVIAMVLLPIGAAADMRVTFTEGAPKDRFAITNTGTCEIGPATLLIDLSSSAGQLIFDTTADGAGVDVFQPVELVAGAPEVESTGTVLDGDMMLEVTLRSLRPRVTIAFTMDLDDQQQNSALGQTRVTGAEINGATVSVTIGDSTVTGRFDDSAAADIPLSACLS
ncbi:MAG: aggregation factor core [Pseudomonadota bacterium]